MGLLDGVLGGAVGAGMVSLVSKVIDEHGGVQGVVDQFEKQGFGGTVRSWVGPGANQAITPEEIHQVLGSQMAQQIAAKFGVSVPQLTQTLSQYLPQAIDKMTPNGVVPHP